MSLNSLYEGEILGILSELGQPGFRARQVFEWAQRGTSIGEMTNLPKDLRAQLSQIAPDEPVSVIDTKVSRDGTAKLLFGLHDGQAVEGVVMRYKHGVTLCLSTQVGCRMGCVFCASTIGGRVRDLTAGEMLLQIHAANHYLQGERVNNVVLMGCGEPFDNYDNVVRFLRLLNDARGMNMSLRGVSVSTCGLPDRMVQFAGEGLPVTLCLSLHAPNEEIRRRIMPIANAVSITQAIGALKTYVARSGRRAIVEYALIEGVNDAVACARELAGLLRGFQCHVNIIPLNALPEGGFRAPSEAGIAAFLKELSARHVSATRRRELGTDILGACGQLRRSMA